MVASRSQYERNSTRVRTPSRAFQWLSSSPAWHRKALRAIDWCYRHGLPMMSLVCLLLSMRPAIKATIPFVRFRLLTTFY